ncbi:uncharacterized protein [Gossypium hirsutum]|uniref:Uncharacterized protein isoform X3 n=1 Tax=Gossypium hirsutum TaxID=3635 RepID=A0A1U8HWS6_GOSHI|nr:uncharacterized protein LOC107888715 isoform X3 [Gossypium hirsutum]XP_016668389.2 uncharacterized protein LOC107888715 isoform X3 [Gossypium hirsutum]XP_016668390.2 uncharacterized protein LOC107888715 isoform X3 [Gossypium hirsutum]
MMSFYFSPPNFLFFPDFPFFFNQSQPVLLFLSPDFVLEQIISSSNPRSGVLFYLLPLYFPLPFQNFHFLPYFIVFRLIKITSAKKKISSFLESQRMGELKDNDAYEEEFLDYEEEDEKAPDSAFTKAADSAKKEPRLLLFLDLLKPPRMFGMRQPPTKIDPNQIPRPISSSSPIVYETRQGNSANPPPPATSDYIVRDTRNCAPCYMRCTTNQVVILGKVVLFSVPIAKVT